MKKTYFLLILGITFLFYPQFYAKAERDTEISLKLNFDLVDLNPPSLSFFIDTHEASSKKDLVILEVLNCAAPHSIVFNDILATEAEMAWTDPNPSPVWNIEYGVEGFTPGTGLLLNATTNPYSFTGLTPDTKYDVYLQSDCGNASLSVWNGPTSLKTLPLGAICEAPIQIASLPYSFTGNTSSYQSNYSGGVGSGCGSSEDYLEGNEVVYEYTASTNEIINISLSAITGFYAGVFVYEDCADIGTSCAAGAVAGASSNNFGIDNFQAVAGQTYYIVVSSWLTPTIGFTLDIAPFDCTSLGVPVGQPLQDFVTGHTLADLDVATTISTATISWYSDVLASVSIPETTVLVNGTTYYVTQSFSGCESSPFAIEVNEIDCTILAITSSTSDMVMCNGVMTLSAIASGNGTDIFWYDAAVDGNLVHKGAQFTTPALSSTTSYWATEVVVKDVPAGSNPLPTGYCFVNAPLGCFGVYNIDDFILTSTSGSKVIEHLSTGCSTDSYGDFTSDSALSGELTPGNTYNFKLTTTFADMMYFKIWIDIDGDGSFDSSEVFYSSTSAHSNLNPAIGSITIPQNASGSTVMRIMANFQTPAADSCEIALFGEAHDYKVTFDAPVMCEAPRVQVDAVVNQDGDISVDHTDLSYTDSDNTSNFDNTFSGNPGIGCSGANILNGNDVVYHYTADPNNDQILNFSLTNISNSTSWTGMYVYSSCGDIGNDCAAGGTNMNNQDIVIDNYYVNAGEELFIVISSEVGSTGYTLNIEDLDCANIPQPLIDSVTPYFISGDVLDDLYMEYNPYGTLTWYADLLDIPNNPITDSSIEVMVDGVAYYVTQTILNCESAPLTITPVEFKCSDLGTDADGLTICTPGGEVSLDAKPSGIGTEVYWYDSASGGNIIEFGDILTKEVNVTTSFWTSEVFVSHEDVYSGSGRLEPTSTSGYGQDEVGLIFTTTQGFVLESVEVYPTDTATTLDIELIDNSNDAVLATKSFSVPTGTGIAAFTLDLNFPITAAGEYKLVQSSSVKLVRESSSSLPFPFALGSGGSLGNITSGVNKAGVSSAYYYFYNWTIATRDIGCESPRQEVVVTINDQPTPAPTGDSLQEFCDGSTVADIIVNGMDLTWYSSDTSTTPLSPTSILLDGSSYYASQTIDACESDIRLKVTVDVLDLAVKPTGAANQNFVNGDMVSDLIVQGDNLTWYFDADGDDLIVDPTTENLIDQETYYVSQTPIGFCESELLAIRVHLTLRVNDAVFAGFSYAPNPTNDFINLAHTSEIIESVSVYNMLGQKVINQNISSQDYRLDTSSLTNGTYVMQISINGKSLIKKLIKE